MADKDEEARKLAEAHYEVEVGITQIFRITRSAEAEVLPNEPIKLLEVNENTIPVGIMPLASARRRRMAFIIRRSSSRSLRRSSKEFSPRNSPLPDGWTISDLVPRPLEAGDE